jgi:phosphatidylglycerophosphatase B
VTTGPRITARDATAIENRRRLATILTVMLATVVLTPLLPDIDLTTGFADAVVRLTDTASWALMSPLCIVLVVIVVGRPGLHRRRRTTELTTLTAVMLVALAGNALLNEHAVKPALGIPRPNIETLAATGTLGAEIPDAATFYAIGDKDERRLVMADRLTAATTPYLSDLVRDHWIYETGYSLPSGHTTAAMTLATLLAAFGLQRLDGWRRILAIYVIPAWAVAVASSRTLLEVHTAWDVVAGTIVGFCWGMLAFAAVARFTAA